MTVTPAPKPARAGHRATPHAEERLAPSQPGTSETDEGRAPPRAVIERVRPEIDTGRFSVKRTPGELVRVTATIFADGHDQLAGAILYRACAPPRRSGRDTTTAQDDPRAPRHGALRTMPEACLEEPRARHEDGDGWREAPLGEQRNDEWTGSFQVGEAGCYEYTVEAWVDRFATWLDGISKKFAAGQDVAVELIEGAEAVAAAASRAAALAEEPRHSAARAGTEADAASNPAADAEWLYVQARLLVDAGGIGAQDDGQPAPGDERVAGGDGHGPEGGEGQPGAAERRADRGGSGAQAEAVAAAFSPRLRRLMRHYAERQSPARHDRVLRVVVERARARFSTWYEMFPRSAGSDPGRSGTFADAAERLPDIAAMGFDVLYLPPIHPIGRQHRKGRNNALVAGPGDPGSPWAIGGVEGGHTAIEPELGTLDDFDRFVASARRFGLEVALDLAFQASPDHPYVREHPEWFRHRPDGSIKYAENPPKRYQDIYPFDFETPSWKALWHELLDVTLFWVRRGIRIFRVDNPHTKPFRFWEWLIGWVRRDHPDVLFLAEAFTRPAVMRHLAKLGFSQSYTYFTWRTTREELAEYFTELTATEVREYLRPNLFANTPDILHEYLQRGGRPAFEVRLLLAATLGASYGIYSGFELCENRAIPGTEEYEHSEKYEWRRRDWNRPGHIKELIAHVNQIRRQHRALQYDWTLRFHQTDNPALLAYSKRAPEGGRLLLMVVNLDPFSLQHGWVRAPAREWGLDPDHRYAVRDLLSEERYQWRGEWNYVRLEPGVRAGHILRVENAQP